MNWHLTRYFLSLNQSNYVPVGYPVTFMSLLLCCEHIKYSAEQEYFCDMFTEHLSLRRCHQKNCWKCPGLQCYIFNYIYIYIYKWESSLEQFYCWMKKEQKDMILVKRNCMIWIHKWKLALRIIPLLIYSV